MLLPGRAEGAREVALCDTCGVPLFAEQPFAASDVFSFHVGCSIASRLRADQIEDGAERR